MDKNLRGGRINRINPMIQQIVSDCFLNTLEHDPFFKCQLRTYATDARTFWEKVKIKKELNSDKQYKFVDLEILNDNNSYL